MTPDGATRPQHFRFAGKSPVGIQVGTSITLLKCVKPTTEGKHVLYRDFHQALRPRQDDTALMEIAETLPPESLYDIASDPHCRLGLPFKPTAVSEDWFDWPALPDLFPASFPGVKTSRDSFLVDIDLDRSKGA